MRIGFVKVLLTCAVLAVAIPALAQPPRPDAIWAKRTNEAINLNGILSEPAWAKAESVVVQFATDAGIPGSGWKYEVGVIPIDPTYATLKFLVVGNQLYMGARVRDKSVGGATDFNRNDGFLMALKDHSSVGAPKPPAEYFYTFWNPDGTDPFPPGQQPYFIGRWGNFPVTTPRTAEQIANWDARMVVNGTTNSDAVDDNGYTVEMRFNLTPMGYDATNPEGEIIEWNISIYDMDWLWPLQGSLLSGNRVWWQSPWGNTMHYDEVHIYARPDVTVNSLTVPTIRPELYVPNGAAFAAPTIDGIPNESVWANLAYTFDIRFGDNALRQTYPGVGPYRAGQYQPPVNGDTAQVLDPADATVKVFWRDNDLYMGFDVRDQVVQYHPSVDRWDGFIVSIIDRVERDILDNVLESRRLSFQVAQNGTATSSDYLASMVTAGDAQVVIHLNAGTTVDTLGTQADNGYTAELKVDLTALGYPPGLGDGILFLGVDHLDGDSFTPYTDSYGSRTWWFREYENECCPVFAYLAPSPPTDSEPVSYGIEGFRVLGTYPNPGRQSTIQYALARSSQVTLEVFDVAGRLVERRVLGLQGAGVREASFDGSGQGAGMYLYRLQVVDPQSGRPTTTLSGRFIVIK